MKKILTLLTVSMFSTGLAIAGGNGWKALSGSGHSMIVDNEGYLYASGANDDGQLGNGKYYDWDLGIDVNTNKFERISDIKWKYVRAASFNSIGISEDGYCYIWGANTYGQLGNPSVSTYGGAYVPTKMGDAKWTKVIARSSSVLGIQPDGTLWAWGENMNGILGLGEDSDMDNVLTPEQVGADRWLDCGAGFYHSAGIKSDGSLWVWGDNERKQVSNDETEAYFYPVQVGTDCDWVAVGTGISQTVAKKSDNSLWSFGSNEKGELGRETQGQSDATPVKVFDDAQSYSVGDYHVLAIKSDGTLWGWGYNVHGELGIDNTDNSPAPVQIGSAKWIMAEAASYHSLGVQEDGSLWVWGWNRYGQLGLGDGNNRLVPVKVDFPNGGVAGLAASDAGVVVSVAGGIVRVSSENAMSSVAIYGSNGALAGTKKVAGNTAELNASHLPAGVYLVRVVTGSGACQVKIVNK